MRCRPLTLFALIVAAPLLATAADPKAPGPLDGTWVPSAAEVGGKALPDEVRKAMKLVVKGDDYTVTVGKQTDKGTVKMNAKAKPKEVDVTGTDGPNKGKTFPAIFERDGDTLRICYDLSGKARPTEFKSPEGTQTFLVTYQRADDDAAELAKFDGTWQLVSATKDGKETPDDVVKKIRVVIKGGKHTVRFGDETLAKEVAFAVDPTKSPREVTDTLPDGKEIKGIYKLDGDTLTSCVAEPGKDRPKEFAAKADSGHTLRVFKRVKE